MTLHAIVLAAGQGTRMRSDVAKVLHMVAGRSLLDWSLTGLAQLPLDSIAVVVGHQARAVGASIADHDLAPLIATALQPEQLGTGHAARVGLAALRFATSDTVIVVPGDMPLLRAESLEALIAAHRESGADATIMTAIMDDPTGYGRIKRVEDTVVAIVEQADASEEEAAIEEVNTSVYAFEAGVLVDMLSRLGTVNAQGEEYLTDVIGMLSSAGFTIAAVTVPVEEAIGVNTVDQLAVAERILLSRPPLA